MRRAEVAQLAHRHARSFLGAHVRARLRCVLPRAPLPDAHPALVRGVALLLARARAAHVLRRVTETFAARGLDGVVLPVVVACHAHLELGAPVEIAALFELLADGAEGVRTPRPHHVGAPEHVRPVVVHAARAHHAVEAVDRELDRGVDVDSHVGRGRERHVRPAEKGENQAGRRREARRKTALGPARDRRRFRQDKGEVVLLVGALPVYGGERALLEPLGGTDPREGVAHPHLGVGHDSTSLSLRLPREIHE